MEQTLATDNRESSDLLPPAKRLKVQWSDGTEKIGDSGEKRFLHNFKMIKVLNENADHKSICIHGRYEGCDDDAVFVLEKTPFSEETVMQIIDDDTGIEVILQNDIYHTMKLFPLPLYNGIKSTLIYPATTKHLEKYSSQETFMISETPEDYKTITLPYIESAAFDIQWVYNILEKKTESERIVFEDTDKENGFVLLPDLKWDGKQLENLYMVAIVQNRNIKSIRDLTQNHLHLLENIRDKGTSAIIRRFEMMKKEKLRVFFHYQPTYYHLHVHFTHVGYAPPGINIGKAHLLDDVIDNIQLYDDFYQKKTLNFYVKKNNELYKRLKEKKTF